MAIIWKPQKEILPQKSLVLLSLYLSSYVRDSCYIYSAFSHETSQKAKKAFMAPG